MQRKFLIIDDHDDLSSGLKEVFEKLGYLVKTIENRDEAVALDEIEEFDVVITDLDNIDISLFGFKDKPSDGGSKLEESGLFVA